MQNNSNKLAVISLIISAILVIAVIILFMKAPGGSAEAVSTPVDTTDMTKLHEKGQGAIIVYYNSDSLNTRCSLVVEVQKEIMDAQVNAESRLQNKQKEFESWNKKWEAKFPLISSEQEQYQREGEKKQTEMLELQQQLEQELYETQNRLTLTALTRIQKYCRDLALQKGYDYVISYQMGGQVMFCNPKMDITDELVNTMNSDYDSTATEVPADAETAQ
ncbi:MAG: OmpH family outer membrane protein [Bacteroidetes bacterium]|nr:OmpH family outer membrane protein [Bacteroidota bacterium]